MQSMSLLKMTAKTSKIDNKHTASPANLRIRNFDLHFPQPHKGGHLVSRGMRQYAQHNRPYLKNDLEQAHKILHT